VARWASGDMVPRGDVLDGELMLFVTVQLLAAC
jgi:hypothetical protein